MLEQLRKPDVDPRYSYIAAELAGFSLLFPTTDIFSLESNTRDVALSRNGIGEIDYQGQPFSVFSLDAELQRTTVKASDHVLLLFKQASDCFALGCSSIHIVPAGSFKPKPVPTCMLADDPLYREIMLIDDQPACCCSRKALWRHLVTQDVSLAQEKTTNKKSAEL